MHLEKPQDRADNLPAAHLEEARNEPSHSPDTYMVKTIFPDADLPTIHVEGSPIRVSNLPAIHAREPQIRNLPDIHVQEPSIHPVNSPTVPRGNPVPNVPSRYLIYNDSKTYDYYSDDFIPFLSLYYDSLPGKPWQNLESVTMTDQINPSDKSDHLETNNSKFHKSEPTEISMNGLRVPITKSDTLVDSLIIEQNDYAHTFKSHREPMARKLLPLAVEANFQEIDRHNTKQSFLTNSILLGANSKINDTARTDVEKADEKNIHERFSSKFNNFPIPNFKSNQDIAVNAQNFVPDISKLFNSETTENYPATNEKYIVYLGRDYATDASQNIPHVTFNNDYRYSPSFNDLNHSHHSIGELFFENIFNNVSNTIFPDEKEENTSEEEEKFSFYATPSSSFKSMDYKSESLNTAEPENQTSNESHSEQDHIVRNDIENIHGTLKSVFQRAASEISDENRYSSDGIFSHDHLDEGNENRDSSITDDPTNNSPDTGVTKYVNYENKIKTPILFLAEDKYLDGSYNFEYRSADGTSRQEVGTVLGEGGIRQHGRFAFRNGNGYETRVVYTADEKGYIPIISYSNSS
ncbi:uncharacterized protein LOC108671977 [Hyalella azteca]|uniref:Uncharacterized protein LOC108671977 n=1 Tax=Hyalella azteca TaxID=294128 RepID=A0A8B7NN20_HYAAZ|nr:uncharacterized protein LOC108671977 [Hyalella azteca]